MWSYTDKIVVINSTLNLIFAILDGIWNCVTQTTLSVFALTNALARTKRLLCLHFIVSTASYSVFSIIWVFAKPFGEEEYNNSAFLIANNSFSDMSQNYHCIFARTTKEYFLYLTFHWLFCEVLRLLIMTNDVFSKFNFGKKSIIIAYVLYTIPAVSYSYLTCDKFSSWDESRLSIISFCRTIIWVVVDFTVMAMFIAVACLQRKKMAKNINNTMTLKVIYFFTAMGMMFGIMQILHIIQLRKNFMTTESYESFIVVLSGATNFLWTVYSHWNHGVSDTITTWITKSMRTIKRRENIELTDMSTKGHSKTEEEKQPEKTVGYLETHF